MVESGLLQRTGGLNAEPHDEASQLVKGAIEVSRQLGQVALQLKDYALAATLMEQAFDLSADASLCPILGEIWAKVPSSSKAAFYFDLAIKQGHDTLESRLGFARALKALNQAKMAHAAFKQVLALAPNDHEALSFVIFQAMISDNFDEALPLAPNAITAEKLNAAATTYLAPLLPKMKGRRLTDKMPINLLWVGFIKLMFPKAKIIMTRRDALANGFAIYSTYFPSQGTAYGYEQTDTARMIVAERQLAAHWQRLFGKDVLIFGYEQLTEDQEAQTRRLLDFCGLRWHAPCLDFNQSNRAVRTLSSAQVKQKLYNGRDTKTEHYRRFLEPMIDILDQNGLLKISANQNKKRAYTLADIAL